MSAVTVRAPGVDPTQYTGWASTTAQGSNAVRMSTTAARQIRAELDMLVPGRTYTFTLRASANPVTAGAAVYAVLGGISKPLTTAYTTQTWTLTVDGPLRLDVPGITYLQVIQFTITSEVPAASLRRQELPGDVLSLEILAPRPGAQPFVLDQSRLDRDALTRRVIWPGTMTLGTGRLGQSYLAPPDLVRWWQPILGKARALTTQRGATGTLVPTAEVGTLVAEFPNDLDPRAYSIQLGTPVRLYHWRTRTLIWSGTIDRAQVQPERPGARLRFTTTLEAVDAVAPLAGITRYGAIPDGSEATGGLGRSESWAARAARLMASAPGVPWRIATAASPAAPLMGATVLETSLAGHLDVLAASAGGCWWVDPDGTVALCPGTPSGAPVAVFTDTASADAAAWSYVDAAAGWDSAEVASVVAIKNHRAEYDGDKGEWGEANTEAEVSHPTLLATYGRNVQSIETNLYDPNGAAAEALGAALVRGQSSQAALTGVALDARPAMARAAALGLFQPVTATLRGETRQALAAAISHTITPHAWHTQVDLLERT